MTPAVLALVESVERADKAATAGPWQAWRRGNAPLASGRVVGHSALAGVESPYQPRAHASRDMRAVYLEDHDADAVCLYRTAAPALAATVREMAGENTCDVCAGTGDPGNGRQCMCEGAGTMSAAARVLRFMVLALEAGVEDLYAKLASLTATHVRDTQARLDAEAKLDAANALLLKMGAEQLSPDPKETNR